MDVTNKEYEGLMRCKENLKNKDQMNICCGLVYNYPCTDSCVLHKYDPMEDCTVENILSRINGLLTELDARVSNILLEE